MPRHMSDDASMRRSHHMPPAHLFIHLTSACAYSDQHIFATFNGFLSKDLSDIAIEVAAVCDHYMVASPFLYMIHPIKHIPHTRESMRDIPWR